jgi:hypothetical protein
MNRFTVIFVLASLAACTPRDDDTATVRVVSVPTSDDDEAEVRYSRDFARRSDRSAGIDE